MTRHKYARFGALTFLITGIAIGYIIAEAKLMKRTSAFAQDAAVKPIQTEEPSIG